MAKSKKSAERRKCLVGIFPCLRTTSKVRASDVCTCDEQSSIYSWKDRAFAASCFSFFVFSLFFVVGGWGGTMTTLQVEALKNPSFGTRKGKQTQFVWTAVEA